MLRDEGGAIQYNWFLPFQTSMSSGWSSHTNISDIKSFVT